MVSAADGNGPVELERGESTVGAGVARESDARSHVQRSGPIREVVMRIHQSGQQRAAAAVDERRVGRSGLTNGDNLIAKHSDGGEGAELSRRRVEDADIVQPQRAVERMRQARREGADGRARELGRERGQLGKAVLVSGLHEHHRDRQHRDKAILSDEQERWAEVEAPQRVRRELLLRWPDLDFAQQLEPRHPAGQNGVLALVRCQQHLQVQGAHDGRRVGRQVERVLRVGVSAVVERRPLHSRAVDDEVLFDGCASPARSLQVPANGQPALVQLDVLLDLRALPLSSMRQTPSTLLPVSVMVSEPTGPLDVTSE
jgi:hypothetical protein